MRVQLCWLLHITMSQYANRRQQLTRSQATGRRRLRLHDCSTLESLRGGQRMRYTCPGPLVQAIHAIPISPLSFCAAHLRCQEAGFYQAKHGSQVPGAGPAPSGADKPFG